MAALSAVDKHVAGYTHANECGMGKMAEPHPPRLVDKVRRSMRLKHDSLRTEQAYTGWKRSMRRFSMQRLSHFCGTLLALGLLVSSIVHPADAEYLRRNVLHFRGTSDATALARIRGYRVTEELRDVVTGRVGLKRFEVTADVLEVFKGTLPNRIAFSVMQEQPPTRPIPANTS